MYKIRSVRYIQDYKSSGIQAIDLILTLFQLVMGHCDAWLSTCRGVDEKTVLEGKSTIQSRRLVVIVA